MEPVIERFRTSLAGFHRGDVLHYMDRLAAQHRSEMAGVEAELKRSRENERKLQQEIDALRQAHGSVSAEEAKVRASLEESTRALARLRGELSQTETKLAAARLELGRLHGQVDEMEPMAQKYDQLKDYVATVELDAHHKAQETIDQAKTKAEKIQTDTRQWLDQVLAGYSTLRNEMDRLFQQLRELGEMGVQFDQADEAAQKLQEQGDQEPDQAQEDVPAEAENQGEPLEEEVQPQLEAVQQEERHE